MSPLPPSNQISTLHRILNDNASVRYNNEIINASSKYKIIDTVDVIERLQSENFTPVSWTKTDKKFNSHKIVFKHNSQQEVSLNDVVQPLVFLNNSNNKRRSFSLNVGFYRLACSNGLEMFDSLSYLKKKHIGKNTDNIISHFFDSFDIMIDEKIGVIKKLDNIILQDEQIRDFALKSILLKFKHMDNTFNAEADRITNDILSVNRTLDRSNTLWKVYNTVQENLFNGNYSFNGRKRQAIKSEWSKEVLNKKLWSLATDFSKEVVCC